MQDKKVHSWGGFSTLWLMVIVVVFSMLVVLVAVSAKASKPVPNQGLPPVDQQASQLRRLSSSDEIDNIDQDLKATNLDNVDADLGQIAQDLNSL